jgi:lipopolysaccharide/colanic/teichoic acid biosynthesis glycosyltransferase
LSRSIDRAKRCLDLASAVCALGVLAPLFPVLAVLIKLESRGPVLASRRFVGAADDDIIDPVPVIRVPRFRVSEGDGGELTRVGRVLRCTHLEGLPAFWSVLRGQMSLVGPRPLDPELAGRLVREVPACMEPLARVKPGVFAPAPTTARRDDESSLFGLAREKVMVDLAYAARLAGMRRAHEVLAGDLDIVGRSLFRGRSLGRFTRRACRGNELIRIDYPRRMRQVQADARRLARRRPGTLGAEVTATDDTVTAWWYPPRGDALDLGPSRARSRGRRATPRARRVTSRGSPIATEVLCDEAEWEHGPDGRTERLMLARRLAPPLGGSAGTDVIRIELPAGLHDVHLLCEHLVPIWAALAPRSDDPHFAAGMGLLLLDGLQRIAADCGCEDRLVVENRLSDRRAALIFETDRCAIR